MAKLGWSLFIHDNNSIIMPTILILQTVICCWPFKSSNSCVNMLPLSLSTLLAAAAPSKFAQAHNSWIWQSKHAANNALPPLDESWCRMQAPTSPITRCWEWHLNLSCQCLNQDLCLLVIQAWAETQMLKYAEKRGVQSATLSQWLKYASHQFMCDSPIDKSRHAKAVLREKKLIVRTQEAKRTSTESSSPQLHPCIYRQKSQNQSSKQYHLAAFQKNGPDHFWKDMTLKSISAGLSLVMIMVLEQSAEQDRSVTGC